MICTICLLFCLFVYHDGTNAPLYLGLFLYKHHQNKHHQNI